MRDDIPNLLLLCLLVAIATSAIATADWADGLWGLLTVALVSVVTGYLITVADFSDSFALLMSTVYGVFLVGSQVVRLLPQELPILDRLVLAYQRVEQWIWAVAGGEQSEDTLIFVIILGLLFWFLGYGAVRNLFRHQRFWRAVLPTGLALVVNVYYYYDPSEMATWVIGYLFVTFVLATRTTAIAREWLWRRHRAGFTSTARTSLVWAGIAAAVLLVILAWLAPPASASSRLASAWERASDWDRIRDTWDRLFGSLRGGRVAVADYYGGARLRLGGSINLGDTPVMRVTAREGPRYYWRSRIFDTYENGSWIGSGEDEIRDEYGTIPYEEETYQLRQNVHQGFEMAMRASRLTYAAAQPLSVGIPVRVEVTYTDERRGLGTPLVVYADQVLAEGDLYNAISSVSEASENDLRSASTDYPAWVMDRYLQLPPDVNDRTRGLAAEIAAPYDNPYDIASAIEDYLREEMTYNEQIAPPPSGIDPVDYFLFETQEGYCVYYASAMAVMLRTQGIPARLAAGFAQGVIEREGFGGETMATLYIVVESDAHTWVEVYFPEYGWIEFEPTSNEMPIDRASAGLFEEEMSPRETEFDPADLQTPDEEPELESQEEQDREFDSAGIGPGRVARGLLRVLRTIFLVLVGAGLIAGGAVGALYWAEHRGLRGLSEVSRTYARLNLYSSWMKLSFAPGATPYERAQTLSVMVPEGREVIQRIVDLYVKEQYAPFTLTDKESIEAASVARSWRDIRPAFLRRVIRRRLAKYWSSQ